MGVERKITSYRGCPTLATLDKGMWHISLAMPHTLLDKLLTCQTCVWSSRVLDKSAAFGGEPDIFDIFKLMLGEGNKRFNNPLRRLLRPKVNFGS